MSNALKVSLILTALDDASPAIQQIAKASSRLDKDSERAERGQAQRLDKIVNVRKRVRLVIQEQSKAEQAADKISQQIQRREETRANLAAKRQQQFQKAGQLRSEMMGLLMGGAAVAAPIKMAISWESSWADVNKVAAFTEEESRKYSNATLALSTRIPTAATDLAAIMQAGAQSGLPKDELLEFAEAAAKMRVAFNISGETAGQYMANWRSGLGLTQARVIRLADAVNHLGNNMNATAPDIGTVLQRLGPFAQTAGLAEEQTAALAAAMLAPGTSAEVAATGAKKFISALTSGDTATDSTKALWRKMGFDPAQIAKDMQTNAPEVMRRVLMAIRKQRKDLQPAIIGEIFGEMGLMSIAPLVANMEQFDLAMSLTGNDDTFRGSMEAEYQTRAKTTENSLILLRNQLSRMSVTIGSSVLPLVSDMAKGLADVADKAAYLAENYPGVTKAVMAAAMGMVALKAGMLGVKMVSNTVGGAITTVQWAATYLARDSRKAAASQDALASATRRTGRAATAANAIGKMTGAVGRILAFAGPIGLVASLGMSFLDLSSAAERAAAAQQTHAQIQAGLSTEIEKAGGTIAQLAASYDQLSESARAAKAYQLEQQLEEQKGAVKTSRSAIHSLYNTAWTRSNSGGDAEHVTRWAALSEGATKAKEAASADELREIFGDLLRTANGDADAEKWVRQLASIIEGKDGGNGLADMLELQDRITALKTSAEGKELTPAQQRLIAADQPPVSSSTSAPDSPGGVLLPASGNTDAQRAALAALASQAIEQARAAQAEWDGGVAPSAAPPQVVAPPAPIQPNFNITVNGMGADEAAALVKRTIEKAMAEMQSKREADARRSLHDG